MAMNEDLAVDADGIPILTELVHEYEIDASTTQYADDDTDTPASIADRLLASKSFQKQIEQLTATLSQQLLEQVEQSLRPAIEQAVSLTLEDSNSFATTTIQQQLEKALPDLLAQALKK